MARPSARERSSFPSVGESTDDPDGSEPDTPGGFDDGGATGGGASRGQGVDQDTGGGGGIPTGGDDDDDPDPPARTPAQRERDTIDATPSRPSPSPTPEAQNPSERTSTGRGSTGRIPPDTARGSRRNRPGANPIPESGQPTGAGRRDTADFRPGGEFGGARQEILQEANIRPGNTELTAERLTTVDVRRGEDERVATVGLSEAGRRELAERRLANRYESIEEQNVRTTITDDGTVEASLTAGGRRRFTEARSPDFPQPDEFSRRRGVGLRRGMSVDEQRRAERRAQGLRGELRDSPGRTGGTPGITERQTERQIDRVLRRRGARELGEAPERSSVTQFEESVASAAEGFQDTVGGSGSGTVSRVRQGVAQGINAPAYLQGAIEASESVGFATGGGRNRDEVRAVDGSDGLSRQERQALPTSFQTSASGGLEVSDIGETARTARRRAPVTQDQAERTAADVARSFNENPVRNTAAAVTGAAVSGGASRVARGGLPDGPDVPTRRLREAAARERQALGEFRDATRGQQQVGRQRTPETETDPTERLRDTGEDITRTFNAQGRAQGLRGQAESPSVGRRPPRSPERASDFAERARRSQRIPDDDLRDVDRVAQRLRDEVETSQVTGGTSTRARTGAAGAAGATAPTVGPNPGGLLQEEEATFGDARLAEQVESQVGTGTRQRLRERSRAAEASVSAGGRLENRVRNDLDGTRTRTPGRGRTDTTTRTRTDVGTGIETDTTPSPGEINTQTTGNPASPGFPTGSGRPFQTTRRVPIPEPPESGDSARIGRSFDDSEEDIFSSGIRSPEEILGTVSDGDGFSIDEDEFL
jgi:hypothetical protein